MKKFLKYFCMAAAVLVAATAFVSCDDDDDKDFKPGDLENITGVYNGAISAKVMTIDCKIEGKYDVSVQKQDEDDVIIVIPQCSYTTEQMPGEKTIPQLVIRDVDVDRTGVDAEKYLFEEDDFEVTVDGVKYTGSIYGSVKGSELELNYQVTPGNMPMPINFTFAGNRTK